MSKKLPLPIGNTNFEEIIGNHYYVDKSLLIEELLENAAKVTLFTRPRRFGKTLNMHMLKEFFDIQKDSTHLFKDLSIAKTEYYSAMNGYPVLFFSFKDSKGKNLLAEMKVQLFHEFDRYKFIQETLDSTKKRKFDLIFNNILDLQTGTIPETDTAVRFLCEIISNYYKKDVVILIDEYDTPMQAAYSNGTYDTYKDFFTSLYSTALKDNKFLKMAVLTGIQRIAKENIFSGLNNLDVITVKSKEYNSCFGFTKDEVEALLAYSETPYNDDVKEMYDGYNFGECEIYNPWSSLNYARKKELAPYWTNTSSNTLIKECILNSDDDFKENFEKLITDGSVSVTVNTDMSFLELKRTETLWGLLLNGGYITAVDEYPIRENRFKVRIPNYEVKQDFKNIVTDYTKTGTTLDDMFYYLITEFNIGEFTRIYKKMVLQMTSYHDAKKNAYHMLFLGMCAYLQPSYEVKSNIEAGLGRSDIILKAVKPILKHVVIEFKQGDDVENLAKDAIQQIKEKKYYADLTGDILLVGVAHNKKECNIKTELLCHG